MRSSFPAMIIAAILIGICSTGTICGANLIVWHFFQKKTVLCVVGFGESLVCHTPENKYSPLPVHNIFEKLRIADTSHHGIELCYPGVWDRENDETIISWGDISTSIIIGPVYSSCFHVGRFYLRICLNRMGESRVGSRGFSDISEFNLINNIWRYEAVFAPRRRKPSSISSDSGPISVAYAQVNKKESYYGDKGGKSSNVVKFITYANLVLPKYAFACLVSIFVGRMINRWSAESGSGIIGFIGWILMVGGGFVVMIYLLSLAARVLDPLLFGPVAF